MSFLMIVNIVKSLLIVLCLGEIDMRKETLERHLTRGKRQNILWRVLCAAAVPGRRNRRCTPCFRNGQTLALVGSVGLAMTRSLRKCPNPLTSFVLPLILAYPRFLKSDALPSTYKLSYARNLDFQLLDERGTS